MNGEREPGGAQFIGFRSRLGPGTKYLLIVNIAIYVLELIIVQWMGRPDLLRHVILIPDEVLSGYVWQLVSYGFLHDYSPGGYFHILFNMIILWLFGLVLEEKWGTRQFLIFYCISLIGSSVFTVIISLILPGIFPSFVAHLGASGAIMGLIAGFALTFPDQYIYLFFLLPIKGKWILPISVAVDLIAFLSGSNISFQAHLGGMMTGLLLISGYWRPKKLYYGLQLLWYRLIKKKSKLKLVDIKDYNDKNKHYLN